MYKLATGQGILVRYLYQTESEFEQAIIKNKDAIFGTSSIFFDTKKKIGNTIPDGYLLDLTDMDPKLYFIEIEMENHDLYGHIAEQLLKFSVAFEDHKNKLRNILSKEAAKDVGKQALLKKYIQNPTTKFNDEASLFYHVVYEMPISIIVIIDERTQNLERVVSRLSFEVAVLEFESYKNGREVVHRFTPLYDGQEINITDNQTGNLNEVDTVIAPACEDGFWETFIGENCWYAIRISAQMRNRIKYIAAYQVAPISAVTYYAQVGRIEEYEDTGKCILYFKGKPKKIGPIPLGSNKMAVRSCRYTNLNKLLQANTISDLW